MIFFVVCIAVIPSIGLIGVHVMAKKTDDTDTIDRAEELLKSMRSQKNGDIRIRHTQYLEKMRES